MIQGRYGVALTFEVPIIKAGARDFAASGDWTPAAGDVKISKDGGAFANITTLPTALGNHWQFSLSATEMEAKRIVVQVVDSATKAVEDQAILVSTLPSGAVSTGKLQSGSTTTAQLAAAESFGADDRIKGYVLELHAGTGAPQTAGIAGYVNATDTATFDRTLPTAVDGSTYYTLWPVPGAATTTSVLPGVNVIQAAGTAWNSGAITASTIATDAIDADALAASAVDEILDEVVEGSTTVRQMLRGFASALLAKASGLATTTAVYRDLGDVKARITATVDADGNRSAVTLDLT